MAQELGATTEAYRVATVLIVQTADVARGLVLKKPARTSGRRLNPKWEGLGIGYKGPGKMLRSPRRKSGLNHPDT